MFLLYFTAAFTALFGGLFDPIQFVVIAGSVAAGLGIANERKWGYGLGIAMAVFPFVYRFWATHSLRGAVGVDILTLMFEVALVALLLHPQSRDYQRIWFK